MDHNLDPIERDAEQQVRLEHLETLVDRGRGVDRDHRAHRPGGVVQRLGGCHALQVVAGPATERATGCGEHETAYLLRRSAAQALGHGRVLAVRSEEHTSELQSLMRISYAVFCLKKKIKKQIHQSTSTS